MSEPLRIVIDPFLLCLRSAGESKEAFESFAMRLESWAGAIGSEKVSILVSERCVSDLIQTNTYPFLHTIEEYVRKFGSTHIAADLLDKIAQWILDLRPYFEDAIDTDVVIPSKTGAVILPKEHLLRLSKEHQGSFFDTLLAAAHFSSGTNPSFEIAIGSSPSDEIHSESLDVSGSVDGYFRRDGESVVYDPPRLIREDLACVFDCGRLVAASDIFEIWNSAHAQEDVCRAFEFRVKEHQRYGLAPKSLVQCMHLMKPDEWQNRLKEPKVETQVFWMLGASFMDSIRVWNFDNVDKQVELLVDASSRILLGTPKQEVKEFRENETSKVQKKRDDGALAWRTHLSKSGVAYRLLFWTQKDGTIEFANVANKAECRIY